MRVFSFYYLILASAIQVYSRNIYMQNRNIIKENNDAAKQEAVQRLFNERNSEHWKEQAQLLLKSKVSAELNKKVAKNVILFLGDGMSITTLAATRTYLGNIHGYTGEEIKLSFEGFPFTGLAKTYCVDFNVADSACSGTAFMTGVKANSGTLGLTASVKRGDCQAQKSGLYSVNGLMHWAQKAGKATGLVTTTRITHATPAASYAHSADRKWEADADVPMKDCEDIASQLVRGDVGNKINVIMGGGRRNFYPDTERDPEGIFGHRADGVNLVNEWLHYHRDGGKEAEYIYGKSGLENLNVNNVSYVLGLFSPSHMPYHLEASSRLIPTLTDMTLKAIDMLKSEKNGFFLFVEGGRIDTAHHETKAWKALDETAEMAKAVEAALQSVDPDDTLVVVTADHSHTMTYSGYSIRGSKILGLANKVNGADGLPLSILSYANGPGYKVSNGTERYNLNGDNINDINYEFPSLVPMSRETHGGEDVAVFAKGPWAHLFSGNYEQNYLPHAISYAACIGEGMSHCESKNRNRYNILI